MRSWKLWALLLAVAATIPIALAWRSYPSGDRSFDTSSNGLWVGHKWYTGRDVVTGAQVSQEELAQLASRLRTAGIRYVFVHAGPLLADGSIADRADPLFGELLRAYPEGLFVAWLGARIENIDLLEESWRQRVVAVVKRLRTEGFVGVHFNLEPLRDRHPGYVELLASTRSGMGDAWLISQATPRLGPLGFSFGYWSGEFYRTTMEHADQTVLMAYDTPFPWEVAYVAFVRDQSRRLIEWACGVAGHEVLIGIPSYHDVPAYSEPSAENIRNATLGVRAALESFSQTPSCFSGVAIYANWVTDEAEWSQYDQHWRRPASEN